MYLCYDTIHFSFVAASIVVVLTHCKLCGLLVYWFLLVLVRLNYYNIFHGLAKRKCYSVIPLIILSLRVVVVETIEDVIVNSL